MTYAGIEYGNDMTFGDKCWCFNRRCGLCGDSPCGLCGRRGARGVATVRLGFMAVDKGTEEREVGRGEEQG